MRAIARRRVDKASKADKQEHDFIGAIRWHETRAHAL